MSGSVASHGRSGIVWYSICDASSGWLTSIDPLRSTSVMSMGASVTTLVSPSSWMAATRPAATLVMSITEPTFSLLAPGADLSIVHTNPFALAERIADAPPPTTTTSGW